MPKVSVIVPVYNRETRLGWCINSILSQTMRNLELILVDDGSTDGSLSICENYARLDNRVRVFHQENGGVSSARNRGIAQAKGEYIQFVDSDDWIPQNFTEILLTQMEQYRADLAICDLKFVYIREQGAPEVELLSSTRRKFPKVLSEKEFWERLMFMFSETSLLEGPCNQMYRSEIIQNEKITFPEDMSFGEACCFNLNFYDAARQIVFVPEIAYYPIKHTEDALSTRCITNLFDNQMKQIRLMWKLLEKHDAVNKENRSYWGTYCAAQVVKSIESLDSPECKLSAAEKRHEIKRIMNCSEVRQALLEADYVNEKARPLQWVVRKNGTNEISGFTIYWLIKYFHPKRDVSKRKIQNRHLARRALVKLMRIAQKLPLPSLQKAAGQVEYNLITYGGRITCKKILENLKNKI